MGALAEHVWLLENGLILSRVLAAAADDLALCGAESRLRVALLGHSFRRHLVLDALDLEWPSEPLLKISCPVPAHREVRADRGGRGATLLPVQLDDSSTTACLQDGGSFRTASGSGLPLGLLAVISLLRHYFIYKILLYYF